MAGVWCKIVFNKKVDGLYLNCQAYSPSITVLNIISQFGDFAMLKTKGDII